jgi:alkyldihydroxyacetonephosphate synthase
VILHPDQQAMVRAAANVIRRRLRSWQRGEASFKEDLRSLRGDDEPTERHRSFWGWGWEGMVPDRATTSVLLEFLRERFDLDSYADIRPPLPEQIRLRSPRFELPKHLGGFTTAAHYDRLCHSYGKAFRDIVRGLHGEYDNPPDYVAYPTSEEQIVSLMRYCADQQVALVPFGGGSSVVGGVEPTQSSRYRGVVTLDLKHFNRLLSVDSVSRTARVQAGIFGPALEEALKPHGLSPRFYPQSFEFSTLGGWIATRAGGHYCTLYTHIDDIVESVRVVTPQGIHETRRLPASGAGPSPERLWLGSEGTLGVITEANIRLHARPRFRSSASVRFRDFGVAAEAVRELSQAKLYPVNCRLVSRLEAVGMGLGDGRHHMLVLGFESAHYPQQEPMRRSLAICKRHGGRWNPRSVAHSERSVRSGSAGRWRKNFLKAPYLRDVMARKGMVTETFETAVTWDRFQGLHDAIRKAAQRVFDSQCQGRGLMTVRFTHVYPDGPAPYYSVIAWSEPGRQLQTWDAIKAAVSDAIVEHGGTITHHHAVGRDHRPWHERERGPIFTRALAGVKSALDPAWVLNPGVLLEER